MVKERLHYIDVFKGILLILVVIHHAPLVCEKFHNPYMNTYWINNFIIAFFMPAWFVSTGYCSNFDKSFKTFLWNNFKGIMIPCFTLYCINHFFTCLNTYLFEDSSWMTLSNWFNPGIRTFFREGGFYWFLSALFISKLIFWIVNKFVREKFQFIFLIVIFLIGLYLYKSDICVNFFFFEHAMMLTFFLYIGKLIKKNNNIFSLKFGILASIIFLVTIVVMSFFEIQVPTITRAITINYYNSFLFLILSFLGSCSSLFIAKVIDKCKLLEYIGNGSIVMYAFNYITLTIVANAIVEIIHPIYPFASIICFCSIIIISLYILIIYYWILNHRYLKAIIGKF